MRYGLSEARVAIIIVGSVIRARTIPPTIGADLGRCITFKNSKTLVGQKLLMALPRLLIFTSIKSVNLFLGANSSRKTPAATAIGMKELKLQRG